MGLLDRAEQLGLVLVALAPWVIAKPRRIVRVAVAAEDQAAFDVMTSILSYRMMFDLRETRGLAYRLSISSGSDGSSQWLTAAMGTSPNGA